MSQRYHRYDIFTESYHTSERQQEVRREQTWNLKARLEFTANSKHPRLSQYLSMEPLRGVRGTESRNLRDGTPNPAYIVEWAAAVQLDLITGGALKIESADVTKFKRVT